MKATAKIVSNQFHNRYYAFAIFTVRSAHSRLTSARRISVANATTQLIVKIDCEMSTIREPLEPKVDVQGCHYVNCCTALLRVSWLAINVNRLICIPRIISDSYRVPVAGDSWADSSRIITRPPSYRLRCLPSPNHCDRYVRKFRACGHGRTWSR